MRTYDRPHSQPFGTLCASNGWMGRSFDSGGPNVLVCGKGAMR